jgi:hypothetical protein
MSASSEQPLREIATHLRSIDDSLKTIAKAVEFRSGAKTLREFMEGGTPGGSIPAGSPPLPDDLFIRPHGRGSKPYL